MAFKVIGHQHLIILSLYEFSESSNVVHISRKHIRFPVATSKLFCADFEWGFAFRTHRMACITNFLAKTFSKKRKINDLTVPEFVSANHKKV